MIVYLTVNLVLFLDFNVLNGHATTVAYNNNFLW